MTITFTPSALIIPTNIIVSIAPSFGIGALNFTYVGLSNATYTMVSTNAMNITGFFTKYQMEFVIGGLISPIAYPTDYTIMTSYQ